MVLAMSLVFAFFILAVALAMSGVLKDLVAGAFLVTDKGLGAGYRIHAGGIDGIVESVDTRRSSIRDETGRFFTSHRIRVLNPKSGLCMKGRGKRHKSFCQ